MLKQVFQDQPGSHPRPCQSHIQTCGKRRADRSQTTDWPVCCRAHVHQTFEGKVDPSIQSRENPAGLLQAFLHLKD